MPEPTTAAVLGGLLIASAVKQLGERIGDAIADGIFGKANDFSEIKDQLAVLNQKVDEILHYSRSTYALVERLPDIVAGLLDQQTLYLAHNDIQSNYEAYVRLPQWHGTIGHSTMASLLASWNIVIQKESSLERILNIPQYGEFLLSVTNGQLLEPVRTGTSSKVAALESLINNLVGNELEPAAAQVQRLIDSGYVKSGSLLDTAPWVSWVMQGPRTRTERECVERPCAHCNGSIVRCWDVQVPDTAWNVRLPVVSEELNMLASRINEFAKVLHSAVLARELLTTYLSTVEARSEVISQNAHVRIVESVEAFPAGA